MERAILNYLPSWLLITLIVSILTGIILVIHFAIRKWDPEFMNKENRDFLGPLIGIAAASYGILVGFVIITLWQSFNTADLVTSHEAQNLALIVLNSEALPPQAANPIRRTVREYVNTVVHEEWDLMRWGESSPKARHALQRLRKIVQSYEPQTSAERTFYADIVASLNRTVENRTQRLESLSSLLVGPLSIYLVGGALLMMTLVLLLQNGRRKMFITTVIMTSILISFIVGLAFSLDLPFSGDMAVSSDHFTHGVLAELVSAPTP